MQVGGEDPQKINKLVQAPGQLTRFHDLYRPILKSYENSGLLSVSYSSSNDGGGLEWNPKDASTISHLWQQLPKSLQDGRSAIEELARKVQALHALTDFDRGITINVGLIAGGHSDNTVAAEASCGIDIRYRDSADRAKIFEKVRKICTTTSVDGTSSEMVIKGEFHPLNPSPQSVELYDLYV